MDAERKLILQLPGQPEQEIPLTEGTLTIGRSRSADVRIDDGGISRIHCTLDVQGDAVWLQDNNSSAGTQLNGKPISAKVSLADTDVITCGPANLVVQIPEVEEAGEGGEEEGGMTRMAPPGMAEREAPPLSEERDTGGMLFEGTRMLDPSELRGLKASEAKPAAGKKMFLGTVLVLALLGGAGYFIWSSAQEEVVATDVDIMNNDYSFQITLPDDWETVKDDEAILAYQGPSEAGSPRLRIYADRNRDYAYTPIQVGFDELINSLKGTPRALKLLGKKKMTVQDLTVMFIGYLQPDRQGKGLMLFNGEDRMLVLCDAPRAAYGQWSEKFTSILQSFTLFRPQQTFDIEPADKAMRELALAKPKELMAEAQQQFDLGTEYMRSRGVQLANLYRAVQCFSTAARMTSALSVRPELYEKAVGELLNAEALFNETVTAQLFEIKLAYRQRDYETMYWEVHKLMQMVPEKANPHYQEALQWLRRLPKNYQR